MYYLHNRAEGAAIQRVEASQQQEVLLRQIKEALLQVEALQLLVHLLTTPIPLYLQDPLPR